MANGLDEARAVAFAAAVREINASGLGIRVFSGLECDILRDGAMDLANDALAELDLVIGSVHSHMSLEAAGNDGPPAARAGVPALAHSRAIPPAGCCCSAMPYPFDFERVAAEAVQARRVAGDQCQSRSASTCTGH